MIHQNKVAMYSIHFLVSLLIMFGYYQRIISTSQSKGVRSEKMQEKTDEQVIACLESRSQEMASAAVQETFIRGERMIPLLVRLKGKVRSFNGHGLGNPDASQVIFLPTGNKKIDKGRVITVEVAALYLISALYHGKLSFAQSALLTDLSMPVEKRTAFNSDVLVEKAWTSTVKWVERLKKDGLNTLRTNNIDPLVDSGVAFW